MQLFRLYKYVNFGSTQDETIGAGQSQALRKDGQPEAHSASIRLEWTKLLILHS